MNITEGSLVKIGDVLFYVNSTEKPYVYNVNTGGKFLDNFEGAVLVAPANEPIEKLMNYVRMHSGKKKNEHQSLRYVAENYMSMNDSIRDIYNHTPTSKTRRGGKKTRKRKHKSKRV